MVLGEMARTVRPRHAKTPGRLTGYYLAGYRSRVEGGADQRVFPADPARVAHTRSDHGLAGIIRQ